MTIEGLEVSPNVRGFDLAVPAGAIVGLAGQVGSGASDVLRGLAGLVPGTSGRLVIDGREVRLGSPIAMAANHVFYCSNDRKVEGLFLSHSLESNVTATRLKAYTRWGLLARGARRRGASRLLELVGIESHKLRKPVEHLSGGNQQKVLIGRVLDRGSRDLLLLDDPTRGVDVAGRAAVHRLIRLGAAEGNAIIFVSTELDELLELADVVVTMFDGRIVSTRTGPEITANALLSEMTGIAADKEGR